MSKMNPAVKAKWVAALRSGEYAQGKNSLRIPTPDGKDQFCCLGVLCNLHAQEHPEIAAMQYSSFEYMGEDYLPPREVYDWAGLEKLFIFPTGCPYADRDLADLNDSGVSFSKIADLIEKYL